MTTGIYMCTTVVGGLIWRTVQRQGADRFVRGIRSWDKDGRDERHLQILNTWGPLVLGPFWWPVPTLFLEGHPDYNHVSSTLVRDLLCRNNGGGGGVQLTAGTTRDGRRRREELATLVPASIVDDVARLYGGDSGTSSQQ